MLIEFRSEGVQWVAPANTTACTCTVYQDESQYNTLNFKQVSIS